MADDGRVPGAVLATGVSAVAGGALLVFQATLMGGIVAFMERAGLFPPPLPPDTPSVVRESFGLFSYWPYFTGAALVAAALLIVAGTALIRRRRWGRALLEALCWVAVVVVVAGRLYGASIIARIDALDGHPIPGLLRILFAAGGLGASLIGILFEAGSLGLVLWWLRGRRLREALCAAS